MTDIERMLTEIRFYEQVIGDAQRTIYCEPSMLAAVQDAVEVRGVGHIYTVRASQACPEGKLLLVDEQAMEAAFQEAAQQGLRRPYR